MPRTIPVIDGYQDLEAIGGGGFSTVYQAGDPRHGRTVAIKVLDIDGVDERARRLFTRECQTMGRVSQHPNIVTIFDSGFADTGEPYLVMPYYPGGSCGSLVKQRGPMSVSEVLQTGVEIASALESAHRADIVHRDVKPDNLFVDSYDKRMLGDFGISAFATPDAANETTVGMSFTPSHASPEVLREKEPGPQADLYSLGSTLYTLLTGTNAYTANSIGSLIMKVLTEPYAPIPRTDIPTALHEIIADLMQKDPTLRPASAAAVARRLQMIQKQEGLRLSEVIVENEAPLPLKGGAPIIDEDRTHVPTELPEVSAPVDLSSPSSPSSPSSRASQSSRSPQAPQSHPLSNPSNTIDGVDATTSANDAKRARVALAAVAALLVIGGFVGWSVINASPDVDPEREEQDFERNDDLGEIVPTPEPPADITGTFSDPTRVTFTWSGVDDDTTATWKVLRADVTGIPIETVDTPVFEIVDITPGDVPCINVSTVVNGISSAPSQSVCALS